MVVLAEPVAGKKGDYAYRAKTGHFKLIANPISLKDLQREFPRWAWLRYPRGKAIVPSQYADRLWKIVNQKKSNAQSTVQILISGSTAVRVKAMAATKRTAFHLAPKLTAPGDKVLFYETHPVSAIFAIGEALSATKSTNSKWYQARVGKVRLLDTPITLAELRQMFPTWEWLRTVTMFAYVNSERANALLNRCKLKRTKFTEAMARIAGGGFGDAKTNALVEQAAVRKVTGHLKTRGYKVVSRERERIGYDLDATKGRTELHVEVKGVSGLGMQFLITQGEVAKAASDPSFRLMVVTQACTANAKLEEFSGRDIGRVFELTPVSYFATKN